MQVLLRIEEAEQAEDALALVVHRLVQCPDGSVIVSRAPHRRKHKVTQKQKDHWSHFQKCTEYGRWASKYYPIYAELAKGTKLTAYNLAVSDFYHPPVIHRIERGEGCIRVEASDNVMVTRVQVTVLDEQGAVLEKGEATRAEGDWWEFPSHAEGKKIVAEAWDLPKNVATLTLE